MERTTNKGRNLTSDFIPFRQAMDKGWTLLQDPKKHKIGFLIILGVNTGLRISDLLSRQHWEFHGKLPGDILRVEEKKTKKFRDIRLNQRVVDGYRQLMKHYPDGVPLEDYIFRSQKGSVYHLVSINDILKRELHAPNRQISSHSLRKSFGRHVWEQNGESEKALITLSKIFRHESLRVTRDYLGITREEIDDIYMNL